MDSRINGVVCRFCAPTYAMRELHNSGRAELIEHCFADHATQLRVARRLDCYGVVGRVG